MSKQTIFTDKAPSPIGPYSQAVSHNGILYASGQIAIDPSNGLLKIDDLDTETHQVMRNIQAVLEANAMNFSHIIKCSIFLSSMNDFAQINEIYGSYFDKDFPARETVEVSCLPKSVNVEISFIAGK